ncbi:hypothetical protein N0V90_001691 [Kalmusia sp. IMI 367209]|nr:hypothetical protein N0V90_001691 [Kalmusia sp. IMI 367209]
MAPSSIASQIHLYNPTFKKPNRSYLIYFITGNPGLIEYYRVFLAHLYGLLTRDITSQTTFHVFGRSLSGFETRKEEGDSPPFSLQEQIARSHTALEDLVRNVRERDGVQDVRVILMGHSVGSYILLEIIRRARERAKDAGAEHARIVGGVCLFPTVTHIAKSDSGRKATPLLTLPSFALAASVIAKALTFFVPISAFSFLVRSIMSFPPDAARVTAAFVKSPHGIHQALHMARDEMLQITDDTWDAEIWGAAHDSPHPHPRPILRFLFAKKDHWVAEETRDELIRARGKKVEDEEERGWKPVMEVDEEEGWPHGFCIRHSIPVAETVDRYVREIIKEDEG